MVKKHRSSEMSSGLLQLAIVSILLCVSMPAYSGFGFRVSKDKVYTLYRNAFFETNARTHVATFDADESEAYNKENCEIARDLFQDQPGVSVTYWCEKGYYRE